MNKLLTAAIKNALILEKFDDKSSLKGCYLTISWQKAIPLIGSLYSNESDYRKCIIFFRSFTENTLSEFSSLSKTQQNLTGKFTFNIFFDIFHNKPQRFFSTLSKTNTSSVYQIPSMLSSAEGVRGIFSNGNEKQEVSQNWNIY